MPIDNRKSPFTRGHLRRVRTGEAPLIPSLKTAEQRLQKFIDRAEPVEWQVIVKAASYHRDAFKSNPAHAMLQRPKEQEIRVRLPCGEIATSRLFFDLEGRVDARLQSPLRSEGPYSLHPAGRRTTLKSADVEAIGAMRLELESAYHYDTLAGALALCRAIRLGRARDQKDLSFAAAHANLSLTGEHLLRHYGGGNCYTFAEVLKSRIEKSLGIKAHVVSERINHVPNRPHMTEPRSHTSQEFLQTVEEDTHVNVVVPFHTPEGELHYLKIQAGRGPDHKDPVEEIYPHQLEIFERLRKSGKIAQERIIGNPRHLQAQWLVGPSKLNVLNWHTQGVFGVDILRRVAYLNTKATAEDSPALQIDLRNSAAAEQLPNFLAQVRGAFGFSKAAIADLTFLLANLDAYCAEVLAGPTVALQHVVGLRDQAVHLATPLCDLAEAGLLASMPSANQILQQASAGRLALSSGAQAVQLDQTVAAEAAYTAANAALKEARQLLVQELPQLSDDHLGACVQHLTHHEIDKTEATELITLIRQEAQRRSHAPS